MSITQATSSYTGDNIYTEQVWMSHTRHLFHSMRPPSPDILLSDRGLSQVSGSEV